MLPRHGTPPGDTSILSFFFSPPLSRSPFLFLFLSLSRPIILVLSSFLFLYLSLTLLHPVIPPFSFFISLCLFSLSFPLSVSPQFSSSPLLYTSLSIYFPCYHSPFLFISIHIYLYIYLSFFLTLSPSSSLSLFTTLCLSLILPSSSSSTHLSLSIYLSLSSFFFPSDHSLFFLHIFLYHFPS